MGSTPLKQISKRIDIRWEDPVVPRYNGQRSQRVQCSPAPGLETEKARQIIASRIEQILHGLVAGALLSLPMQGIALRKFYLFYPTGDNLPCLFGL